MSKAKPLPPRNVMRYRLDYDPATGVFIWRRPGNLKMLGKVAGTADKQSGYVKLHFAGYGHVHAHRLAWLFVYGDYDPSLFCIDHIDGNRSNNAIANLRLATFSQNTAHCKTRRNTKTGVKGVTVTHHGTYRVVIRPHGPGGEKIELGCYQTLEEAAAVRLAASQKHFGSFSKEDDACRAIAS